MVCSTALAAADADGTGGLCLELIGMVSCAAHYQWVGGEFLSLGFNDEAFWAGIAFAHCANGAET